MGKGIGRAATPLRPVVQLCGRYKCDHVFVKDESRNPHGTFKDRRNEALMQLYAEREEAVYVHITSGNSGYSLGTCAMEFEKRTDLGRRVVNIVDHKTSEWIKNMLRSCSTVVEMDLGKGLINDDELVRIAREATGYVGPEDNIINVERYRLDGGYGQIMHEIKAQLDEHGKKPDYIFCPVGGGELAVELAAEAKAIWGDDAPKIIGATVPQNINIRADDFVRKVGYTIADKISCGYSKFKDIVNNFVAMGRIELKTANESEILREYRYLNEIGVNVEPSAAVAFVGAMQFELRPEDVVVIVNSGKGIYDQKAVDRVWVQQLKKALRYAAVFLLGAAAALGVTKAYTGYRKEIKDKLVAQAIYYAHEKDENKAFSFKMHERACQFLRYQRHFPPKESEEQIKKECDGKYIWDLPQGHLKYYIKYKESESNGRLGFDGGIWAWNMRDLTERYQKGEFDDNNIKIISPMLGDVELKDLGEFIRGD